MQFHQEILCFQSRPKSLMDISAKVQGVLSQAGLSSGMCQLFVRHTSASLVIQENADPDVLHDLENFLKRLIPENDPHYHHTTEGPDDMPAHIRSALTHTSESIPFAQGRLLLGTWQGVYLWEHRSRSHYREVVVSLLGR